MIRINLAKKSSQKRKRTRKVAVPRKLLQFGTAALVILICGSVGYYFLDFKKLATKKSIPHTDHAVDEYRPSSFVNFLGIEDIVPDRSMATDKLQTRGILNLPYNQLSFIEQVNYEMYFAKNVLELLGKTALSGVEFKNLALQSFNTFSGVGLSSSRERVKQTFSNLRKENVTILPKPFSYIDSTGSGYRFIIACKVDFGLDFEAPFLLGADDIMAVSEIKPTLKNITETAEYDSVRLLTDLNQTQNTLLGKYRRFSYTFSAAGSYAHLTNFIMNLNRRRIPVAFESLRIKAVKQNELKIDAEIVLTTTFE